MISTEIFKSFIIKKFKKITSAMFVSWNSLSGKLLFKLFYVCLSLENLIPEKFGWKTLSGSCEKFINVILFVDYIKFGP